MKYVTITSAKSQVDFEKEANNVVALAKKKIKTMSNSIINSLPDNIQGKCTSELQGDLSMTIKIQSKINALFHFLDNFNISFSSYGNLTDKLSSGKVSDDMISQVQEWIEADKEKMQKLIAKAKENFL